MRSCHVLLSAVILLIGVIPLVGAESEVLRYKAPAKKLHYSVTITVNSPSSIDTYQGQISYQASPNDANSDNIAMLFSGGLKQSTKSKTQSTSRFGGRGPSRGGPGRGGPPRGAGFMGNRGTETTALQQTKATIMLTPDGDILSLTGSSQIPLPLGHLSILIFDALPGHATDSWATNDGVTLGEKKDDNRIRRGPFTNQTAEERSAGSEAANYTITSRENSQVRINKTYKLDSPNSKPPFTLGGEGNLVFDTEAGTFVSADLKYALVVNSENVQVKIPVTVKYRLLSPAELNKQNQEKRAIAAANLKKGIAAALERFKGFSEEKIAANYINGNQVPPTDRIITPEMKIPVGLIAQTKWPTQYRWSPTKIIEVLPNNFIKCQSLGSKKDYTRHRNFLRLAPDFVDQPNLSAEALETFRKQLEPTPADQQN